MQGSSWSGRHGEGALEGGRQSWTPYPWEMVPRALSGGNELPVQTASQLIKLVEEEKFSQAWNLTQPLGFWRS